jgi:ADP-glucose pyrophosphorylase
VLQRNPKRERFSIVNTQNNLVTGFGGMPAAQASDNDSEHLFAPNKTSNATASGGVAVPDIFTDDAPLMFTGIQILDPRIFDYIPRGVFSHSTTDVYPQAIARGETIAAHVAEGMWYELSTIERYLEISLALLRQRK